MPVTQGTAEAGIPFLPNLAPQTLTDRAAFPSLPGQPQIARNDAKAQVAYSVEDTNFGQPMPAQTQAFKPAQAQAAATTAAAAKPESNGSFFGSAVYPGVAVLCLLIVSGGVVTARKKARKDRGSQAQAVDAAGLSDGLYVISRDGQGQLQTTVVQNGGDIARLAQSVSSASLQNLYNEAKLMEQETVSAEDFKFLIGEHGKPVSTYKVFSESYGADALSFQGTREGLSLQANPQLTCLFIMKYKTVGDAVVCRAAPAADASEIPDMEKRNLMNLILLGSLAATVGGLGGPFLYYFYPASTGGGGGGLVARDAQGDEVTFKGWLETHQAGERKLVQGLKGDATYLLITDDKTIENFGVNAVCTHLGCVVPWNKAENKFMCPCHGSQYDKQGKVVRGPAPLSLALAHVDDVDGKVSLSTWTEDDFRTGLKPWWS